jgi:hypothetical protein
MSLMGDRLCVVATSCLSSVTVLYTVSPGVHRESLLVGTCYCVMIMIATPRVRRESRAEQSRGEHHHHQSLALRNTGGLRVTNAIMLPRLARARLLRCVNILLYALFAKGAQLLCL